MSRIKIKYFGPIKEGLNDWIDIKKVTVLIGNQGSGKSTVAKLISTFTWLEKALYKQSTKKTEIKRKSKFQNFYCEYQSLKNYFKPTTEIEYEGDAFRFIYKHGSLDIEDIKGKKYLVPKIMYVPAERNFVSAVSQPEKLKYLPKTLYTFLEEFERSKQELSESLSIPINNLKFVFDKKKGESKILGNDYDLPLYEASSGLQSSIPLYLVSRNLSQGIDRVSDNSIAKDSLEETQVLRNRILHILKNDKLTEELRSQAIELLSSVTKNDCFINIVEEPEQNLFPSSQWSILKKLLEFNNLNVGNRLIMTTHSPYIVNYLSIAIQAAYLSNDIIENKKDTGDLLKKIEHIVSSKSLVLASDVVIYQLSENDGTITKLPMNDGIPSDRNFLNQSLRYGNEMFDELLEIEQELFEIEQRL